jgi:colanic acid/amylovoran biosynthesis protein
MKIGITNAVVLNSGDAAIAQGIIDALREEGCIESEAAVVVFDDNAAASSRYYPEWDIRQQATLPSRHLVGIRRQISKVLRAVVAETLIMAPTLAVLLRLPGVRRCTLAKSLRDLASRDVVISSGGTYLVDHYKFAPRVRELRLAKALGAEVVLWTQSLGPFKTRAARRQVRRLQLAVDAAYFRDEKSRAAWMRNAKLPPTASVVPDAAFAMDVPEAINGRNTDSSTRVAVSVRKWGLTTTGRRNIAGAYPAAVRGAVGFLASGHADVCAISTCQGAIEYPIDDSLYARDLLMGLPVSVDSTHHTPHQLLERLPQYSAVLATRMHFAILSILAGVPVLAIAYEFKTLELFKGLGLDDFVVPIEEVTADRLVAGIKRLLDGQDAGRVSAQTREMLAAAARVPAQDLAARRDCDNK